MRRFPHDILHTHSRARTNHTRPPRSRSLAFLVSFHCTHTRSPAARREKRVFRINTKVNSRRFITQRGIYSVVLLAGRKVGRLVGRYHSQGDDNARKKAHIQVGTEYTDEASSREVRRMRKKRARLAILRRTRVPLLASIITLVYPTRRAYNTRGFITSPIPFCTRIRPTKRRRRRPRRRLFS